MKKCPFCAEDIQDAAIKCRHCGERLGEAPPVAVAGLDGPGLAPPVAGTRSADAAPTTPPRPPNDLAKLAGSGCLIFVVLFGGMIYLGKCSKSPTPQVEDAAVAKQKCEAALRAAVASALPPTSLAPQARVEALRKRRAPIVRASDACDSSEVDQLEAATAKIDAAMTTACAELGREAVLRFQEEAGVMNLDCPEDAPRLGSGGRAPEEAKKGPTPGVTMANYKRIETGMSYAQVKALLGGEGEELSSDEMMGMRTVMYSWQGRGIANMNAMFQNDKLVNKAQFGLE